MTKLVEMEVLPDVLTTRPHGMISNNILSNLIQLTLVITSLILHSIDAVILYTRSMFISLRLSSELFLVIYFQKLYCTVFKQIYHFCSENTEKLAR